MAAHKWPTEGPDEGKPNPQTKPQDPPANPPAEFDVANASEDQLRALNEKIQARLGNAATDPTLFLRGLASGHGGGGDPSNIGGLDFSNVRVPELFAKHGQDRMLIDLTTARGYHSQDPYVKAARKECLGAFLRMVLNPRSNITDFLPRDTPEALVRTLSSSNSAGGYLVPPGYIPDLTQDIEKESELYPLVRKMPVSQPSGRMPTVATNASVAWGEENTDIAKGDPSFGNATWLVNRLNVFLDMSREIANDTNPGIVDAVTGLIREAMARELDRVVAIGSGSGQPLGLYSAAGITNVTVTALTYESVVNLKHSVAKRYHGRPGFRWVFNQNVLASVMKVLDLEGRPLFQPSIGGEPARVLNTPYVVEDSCPNNFMFIGDLGYYLWFDIGDMGMESSTEAGDAFRKHQLALKVWSRVDGKPVLPPTKPMARTRVLAGVSDLT